MNTAGISIGMVSEGDRYVLLTDIMGEEDHYGDIDFKVAGMSRFVRLAEYNAAEEVLGRCGIEAPVDGVVTKVYRHAGEWVKPGDPVFRLVRIDRLRAEGFLEAKYATKDLTGAPVRLVVEQGGRQAEFPGKIVFVSPEIDPVNGQARVWAEIENEEMRLRAGMRGTLLIPRKRP